MFDLTSQGRRRLVHLLDLLCEHEESVVECGTLSGELDRADGESVRIVLRSRRIWRSTQNFIIKLEASGV